jgi:hypothetical protein
MRVSRQDHVTWSSEQRGRKATKVRASTHATQRRKKRILPASTTQTYGRSNDSMPTHSTLFVACAACIPILQSEVNPNFVSNC